ncbi:MAG: YcxB family protein [Caulobacteraceae bacterium]
MSETQEKSFEIKVKLKLFDYFRYYLSLLNLRLSGKIITGISVLVVTIYTLSTIFSIYVAVSTTGMNLPTIKGVVLNLVVIFLFSIPFTRTFLFAYKDAKTHNFIGKEIKIIITKEKFTVEPENWNLEYSWKKMYRILEFSHGFALFIDKKDQTFVLPKRCFGSKEQIIFVRELIKKYNK